MLVEILWGGFDAVELNTAQDWWDLVDQHWGNLSAIILDQMDVFHDAYEVPGDNKSNPTGRDIGDEIEWLKKNRDTHLARYFHAAWGLASESYAWTRPSWGILCDLCSEEFVLYEEQL